MFRKFIGMIILCMFIFVLGYQCFAQEREDHVPTSGNIRLEWFKEQQNMRNNSVFKNYNWRMIGPMWMSARISDIAIPHDEPHTIYVASSTGGLWKTINEGTTWRPIFDNQPSQGIGDIAIAPSNSDIIWVGTGEDFPGRQQYSGTGVYKSTDAGKTWNHMGLIDSHHIGRILIHPEKPDIVYVAVEGSMYTYNRERGLFKTTNGGCTWEQVLFIDERTGMIDIAMDPTNPDLLYAASWERFRQAWNFWECGPGSGIHRSTDGGKTWEKMTNGFPTKGLEGRIGLAIAPSKPDVVYASLDNMDIFRRGKEGEIDTYGFQEGDIIKGFELYRSENKGETWKKVNKEHLYDVYRTYGYCFGEILVDPFDANKVWILGIPLLLSTDGGRTFDSVRAQNVHVDHHALCIDAEHPNRLINGNDGGVNISYDGGKSWKHVKNLPVTELYHVNVDMDDPFNVYVSAQDINSFSAPVTGDPYFNFLVGDIAAEWKSIPGGEASYIAVDPTDSNIIYSESLYGRIIRSNMKTSETKKIMPETEKGGDPLRCTWLTPFIVSPHNSRTLYWGSQYLFRSLNRGDTWDRVSPDLTDNDQRKRGDVPFGCITTISESPCIPGIIWIGTDDGNVQITTDGGAHWNTIQGLEDKWISRVEASHFHKDTGYVALNGYRNDDSNVYLYKVTEFGKNVIDIGHGIPGGPVNVIREDPKNASILYVGTDTGIFISLDGGATWDTLMSGLPTTFVHDLIVHPRDNVLIAATFGRGAYVLDVEPIQKFNVSIAQQDLYLFDIKSIKAPPEVDEYIKTPPKLDISFYLKNTQKTTVKIIDERKNTCWESSLIGEKGFNQISWNLKTETGFGLWFNITNMSKGRYTVRIEAGPHVTEKELILK